MFQWEILKNVPYITQWMTQMAGYSKTEPSFPYIYPIGFSIKGIFLNTLDSSCNLIGNHPFGEVEARNEKVLGLWPNFQFRA